MTRLQRQRAGFTAVLELAERHLSNHRPCDALEVALYVDGKAAEAEDTSSQQRAAKVSARALEALQGALEPSPVTQKAA